MAYESIKVDIIPGAENAEVLHFSQYDNKRPFFIELFNGGVEFIPEEGMTLTLECRKRDGNIVILSDPVITDNVAEFSSTEQLTACYGDNTAEIKIVDSDDLVIGSANFIINVEKSPTCGGIASQSEIDNLTQQIAAIVPEVIGDDYYNKSETDALLANKANISDLANLASKAELEHAIDEEDAAIKDWAFTQFATPGYIANRYYNKTQVDELLFNMLPIGTASGNPCNFDTEISAVLHALTAEIVASGGNGTPDNPIPIVGHSELNLTRCGVNLWDEEYIISSSRLKSKNVIPVEPNKTYRYINGAGIYASIDVVNAVGGYISFIGNIQAGNTFTTPADCHYLAFTVAVAYGTTYNNDITISDSSNTEYHAYEGQTFTVSFGQTVYGGVLDVTRGKLTITHANIASYNGESINEPWLSSMDTYVPNTTPTTGAQVVYPLTTPFDIDLTPVQISALVGTNNIISDCNGDVNVSYKDSIQHYIDSRI